jgi:hypothetical protein
VEALKPMPPCNQHVNKARQNLQFTNFVLKGQGRYIDWVITAYFYAAVHLVEAYFDLSSSRHYGTHVKRREAISRDSQISGLFSIYRQLETYSRTARYGVKTFDLAYLNNRVIPKFQTLRSKIASFNGSLAL